MNDTPVQRRMMWVEPEVADLSVIETAAAPGRGPDGNAAYPDCTRS